MSTLDVIFDEGLERGATDLHLSVGSPALARVGGELVALEGALYGPESLLELLTPAQRARLGSELYVETVHVHGETRLRASFFQKAGGIGAAFHVLPSRPPSLAELGHPETVKRLAEQGRGLVVVAGPARSGRSTTLAAMLDHVNKTRACNVLAIEDPIQLVYEPLRAHITQREIGTHTPSVEAALRNAAREDPDAIFVAGLPSHEAARHALRLACAGVAVFVKVKARGVVSAIDGIVASFPVPEQHHARSLLSECLSGAIGQELVRPRDRRSRVLVQEVLVATPESATAIREGETTRLRALMQAGEEQGMRTLDAALERLVAAGRVTAEDALVHAIDKEAAARLVSRG